MNNHVWNYRSYNFGALGNVKKKYNVDVQSVSSLGATERCFLCLYSFTFWYIDIINSMLN